MELDVTMRSRYKLAKAAWDEERYGVARAHAVRAHRIASSVAIAHAHEQYFGKPSPQFNEAEAIMLHTMEMIEATEDL